MTKHLQNFLSHSCPPGKPRRAPERSSAFHPHSINRWHCHCTEVSNAWSKARPVGWFLPPLLHAWLQKQGKKKAGGTSLSSFPTAHSLGPWRGAGRMLRLPGSTRATVCPPRRQQHWQRTAEVRLCLSTGTQGGDPKVPNEPFSCNFMDFKGARRPEDGISQCNENQAFLPSSKSSIKSH